MPVIAYKTMSLRVNWAQIRRIRCAECPATFVYVTGGAVDTSSVGVPVLTSDDSMRETVGRDVDAALAAIDQSPELGVARCPACRRGQPWMFRRWFRARAAGIALGLVVAFPFSVGAWFVFSDLPSTRPWAWPAALVPVLFALAVTFVIGCVRVRWELGPPAGENRRAMRDAEFREFLAECAASDADPALRWWFSRVLRKRPTADEPAVSLGILDLAGGFEPPASPTPETSPCP